MYVPPAFAITDEAEISAVIAANSFATVVSCGKQGLMATHVPVLLDPTRGRHGTLMLHMARANTHWQDLQESEAMVVFQGPHAYVSPRWYASDAAVPTWNYVAVHAYGRTRLIFDRGELRNLVGRLSAHYEAGAAVPWTLERVPETQLNGLLKAIVGMEIAIERVDAKAKLSQNRKAEDRDGVVRALAASDEAGDRALADAMALARKPVEA